MARRTDIKKILVIGSGPIQIGQACEFDYSGSQAIRALRSEGFEVVLVNSNPATIMTDPALAHRTYIEPLVPETLEAIIEKERPDAILPTLGGQVALNLTLDLHKHGVFETYGVEVIGAKIDTISMAEDREQFRDLMTRLGLPSLRSVLVRSTEEAVQYGREFGFPLVLRPSFTLGGTGGGIVYNQDQFTERVRDALKASPTSEVLIEESIVGWKEIEYELMADAKGQLVIVCTIENLDPMGIHTGDSITVAPAQTLTDKEHQRLREACKKIARGIGIETGGCNIQFALDPKSERYVIVEMNPRVSRSSALASKATGYPIAKIAALLAVGYHLDELKNDITRNTPACFEPALDYVVIKIPRFNFEKFAQTEPTLGTQMKSVGEVMALGRSFPEAFIKAFHSLEADQLALNLPHEWQDRALDLQTTRLPRYDRWHLMAELMRRGEASVEDLCLTTGIDRWFLIQLQRIIDVELRLKKASIDQTLLHEAKCLGLSDAQIGLLVGKSENQIARLREKWNLEPQLNMVDTCAGEFPAVTPYFYFGYEEFPAKELEETKKEKPKDFVVVLGSGPNRIGQGVEFDYCCVKAVETIRRHGLDAVMINCNPETVSTDYDVSNRLYFEPLTAEHVRTVLKHEKMGGRCLGILCQTGGQTALKLSQELTEERILGTEPDQIDRAEDRGRFNSLLRKLKLKRSPSRLAKSMLALNEGVKSLGFPVLIRPSYVLGGRAMHVIRTNEEFQNLTQELKQMPKAYWPIVVDRFLEDAIEVDVDCIGDGKKAHVAAVMEHIEEAGIHSGDSSCVIPPQNISPAMLKRIHKISLDICHDLKLSGFLNLQLAIHQSDIYVLEVNPRASRTLPFVCKATGVDWVAYGVRAILGEPLHKILPKDVSKGLGIVAVKQVVFPFLKFPGVDVLLGPEMKSTGEVMSIGDSFEEAFVKGLLASNHRLEKTGCAFVSVKDSDKPGILDICEELKTLGYRIVATHGTAKFLQEQGIVCSGINKVKEGHPHIVDALINQKVQLLINTTAGSATISDSYSIRRSALQAGVPYFTNLTAARAAVFSLGRWIRGELQLHCLQDLLNAEFPRKRVIQKKAPLGRSPALSTKNLQKMPRRG